MYSFNIAAFYSCWGLWCLPCGTCPAIAFIFSVQNESWGRCGWDPGPRFHQSTHFSYRDPTSHLTFSSDCSDSWCWAENIEAVFQNEHLSCAVLPPSQGRLLIKLEDSRACLEGILGGEEVQTQRTNMKCSQMFFRNGRVKNPSSKGQRKGKKEESWFWKMRSCLLEEMRICDARVGQFSFQLLSFFWSGLTFEIYKIKVTLFLFVSCTGKDGIGRGGRFYTINVAGVEEFPYCLLILKTAWNGFLAFYWEK